MRELALHVLDALQNSIAAGARAVTLEVNEDAASDLLTIRLTDDGGGMSAEVLARCLDPFYTSRSTRHVGLGLPLFAAAAERAGGKLEVESVPGEGATLKATLTLSHPDRQPLGDLAGTLAAYLAAPTPPRLCYRHTVIGGARGDDQRCFEFDSGEIEAELGEVPMNHPSVQRWLFSYLSDNEAALGGCA